MHRRLYKFFDDPSYAEAMMRGVMRFRTLAYFRDHEDAGVRGDANEAASVYRPDAGVEITGQSRPLKQVWPDSAFETYAKAGEIYVFCMSRCDTLRIRAAFNARACVEILHPQEFYRQLAHALSGVSLGGKPGRERIAHPVIYYEPNKPPAARWACPDLIAISKCEAFEWQHEQRLVFSRTDALRFENVTAALIKGSANRPMDIAHHKHENVDAGPLDRIARLHVF